MGFLMQISAICGSVLIFYMDSLDFTSALTLLACFILSAYCINPHTAVDF